MNFLPQIQEGFDRWIDSVAGTVNSMLDRLRSKREVQVVEVEHDTFILHVEGNAKNPNRNPKLPDYRIRFANGTIAGALPPGWATTLRGSRAEMILRPSRFLFRPLEL